MDKQTEKQVLSHIMRTREYFTTRAKLRQELMGGDTPATTPSGHEEAENNGIPQKSRSAPSKESCVASVRATLSRTNGASHQATQAATQQQRPSSQPPHQSLAEHINLITTVSSEVAAALAAKQGHLTATEKRRRVHRHGAADGFDDHDTSMASPPTTEARIGPNSSKKLHRIMSQLIVEQQAAAEHLLVSRSGLPAAASASPLLSSQELTHLLIAQLGGTSTHYNHVAELRSIPTAFGTSIPTIGELRLMFKELRPHDSQSGIDDMEGELSTIIPVNVRRYAKEERLAMGKRLLYGDLGAVHKCDIAAFAARGIPPSIRRDCYTRLLDIRLASVQCNASNVAIRYELNTQVDESLLKVSEKLLLPFTQDGGAASIVRPLEGSISIRSDGATSNASPIHMETLLGSGSPSFRQGVTPPAGVGSPTRPASPLTRHRSKESCLLKAQLEDLSYSLGNSDRYFIFADTATEAMERVAARVADFGATGGSIMSGVAGHHVAGEGYRLGPLCYLSTDAKEVSVLAAAMHKQLWCHMVCTRSSISSTGSAVAGGVSPSFIQVCCLFESLIAHWAPVANYHLRKTLQMHPLSIAMPWMWNGMASTLAPSEALTLWDRALGFANLPSDSQRPHSEGVPGCRPTAILIFAVCAAAIFAFRADDVLRCSEEAHVVALFEDCERLPAVALMQYFLFVDQ